MPGTHLIPLGLKSKRTPSFLGGPWPVASMVRHRASKTNLTRVEVAMNAVNRQVASIDPQTPYKVEGDKTCPGAMSSVVRRATPIGAGPSIDNFFKKSPRVYPGGTVWVPD